MGYFRRGLLVGFAAGVAFTNLFPNNIGNPLAASSTSSINSSSSSSSNATMKEESAQQSQQLRTAVVQPQAAAAAAAKPSSGNILVVSNATTTTTKMSVNSNDTLLLDSAVVVNNTATNARTILKKKQVLPAIAVVMCVNSASKGLYRNNTKTLHNMSISTLMLPSLQRTMEVEKYNYTIFIGMDDTDTFWRTPAIQQKLQHQAGPSLPIVFRSIPKQKRIPFNEILQVAFEMNSETYIIRINDDSEFVTGNWTSYAIHALAAFDPPNVGVVGPTCHEGNTEILTHDFVHARTHMGIFHGNYYSTAFHNWWIDDWITFSYAPTRMRKLENWVIKHHTLHHGTRYVVDKSQEQLLESEIRKGKQAVANWLMDHNHTV